jgi:hypothetical protein
MMNSAEKPITMSCFTKRNPAGGIPAGFHFGLAVGNEPIKTFTNIIADYTRHYREKKIGYINHGNTSNLNGKRVQ